MEWNISYNFLW